MCALLIGAVSVVDPAAAGQGRGAIASAYRAPRTADGQPDISGIWTNDTLTPLERPTRLGDKENMSPYSRGITRGVPGSTIPNTYNTGNHIFQTPHYIVILYEMVREPRIVPLGNRPPLHSEIRQWMGDARGHWEGETLVIETTHFTEQGWITPNQNAGRMHGVPVSRRLRTVERFTRVAPHVLDWQVRIEDPNVYTQPWTLLLPLKRDMSYDLFEYACREGNRAVTGILGGARHVERLQGRR